MGRARSAWRREGRHQWSWLSWCQASSGRCCASWSPKATARIKCTFPLSELSCEHIRIWNRYGVARNSAARIEHLKCADEPRYGLQEVARQSVVIPHVKGIYLKIRGVGWRPTWRTLSKIFPSRTGIGRERTESVNQVVLRVHAAVIETHADFSCAVHRRPRLILIRSDTARYGIGIIIHAHRRRPGGASIARAA